MYEVNRIFRTLSPDERNKYYSMNSVEKGKYFEDLTDNARRRIN